MARLVALLLLFGLAAGPVAAQDQLIAARGLYAAANYEDALSMLNGLRASVGRPEERPRIDEYRAFCLLALGRGAEADEAIEALITAEPSYRPSDAEASPRVRTAFSLVRRRVLPTVVQQRYAAAKEAFDRKQHAAAADGFDQVLALLADQDVAPSATQSPLSDIRTLASGFRELAAAAAAPPPPPPPLPAAPAPERPIEQPVVSEAPAPAPERLIYSVEDPDVVAPMAIRQTLPPFPQGTGRELPAGGVLEVVVAEDGTVELAVMRSSIAALYDRMVVAAAREWRFRPASRMGVPVKYRKLTQISIKR